MTIIYNFAGNGRKDAIVLAIHDYHTYTLLCNGKSAEGRTSQFSQSMT
jgi:hypothetical protein